MENYISSRLLSFVAAAALSATSHAQMHLGVDLQNNHLWRGIEVADGCVILTDLGYTFAKGHATVGLWGGCDTRGTYKEFNHYVSMNASGFELSAWDTYNFSPDATYNNRQYFNYSAHETGRFLNCTLSYRIQKEQFPLLLSWSTIMFGRDRSSDNSQQKYSTFVYAELPIYKKDGWIMEAGVGGAFALHEAGEKAHFYGDTPGVVHAQLKVSRELHIGSYNIPVHVMGMWNPQADKAYLQIGLHLIQL